MEYVIVFLLVAAFGVFVYKQTQKKSKLPEKYAGDLHPKSDRPLP